MTHELWVLTGTAATIGLMHTLMGPDHYVPFIVMSKARDWSAAKTSVVTFLSGLGHVLSSVVLGAIGVAAGVMVEKLEIIEGHRGDLAAWLLTGFGFLYMLWGLRVAIRNKVHTHVHSHDGQEHSHEHSHDGEHLHVHDRAGKTNLTPWVLFTIFLFGPCEPLIPILMYPAATESAWGVAMVAATFSIVTIATMMTCVLVGRYSLKMLPTRRLQRYMHALAGLAIFASGVAIHLGL
jgi:sulfite exporter TauE/SafE